MGKNEEDNGLWQQNGRFLITVYYGGAGRCGRHIVKANTYSQAIQKIVNNLLKEWSDVFDGDSEIRFVREIYDEIK